jgi:hypothetical protein
MNADAPKTTAEPEFSRRECNVAAARLANNLRRFMADAEQYLSSARRCELAVAAIRLEDMADGR